MKPFLITTALEETWCDDGPVLFLGEWCRLYSRKELWSKMDADVLPYHWDDRIKLHTDYKYLQGLYERLLLDLGGQLNKIHNVDHSLRFWRILIGPWLGYFTQVLFDRWTSIHQAISLYELSETIVLTGNDDALVPKDMCDFSNLYVEDEWNHHIYSSILLGFTSMRCTMKMRHNKRGSEYLKTAVTSNSKKNMKRMLLTVYTRAARILGNDNDVFFLNTYLPTFRDEMKLQLRFGQVPQRWQSVPAAQAAVDRSQRQWLTPGESHSDFEACVRALIVQQIPTIYLEGYDRLVNQIADLPWPKDPKVILTSNSYSTDDTFKAWAAEKVEQGAPLVIGQHGGLYGVGRWLFQEEHEVSISDRYMSWGWSDLAEPKVKPVGQLQAQQPLGVRHDVQTGVLLVTCTMPRQSYHMYSAMVSSQWLDYFNDQCAFIQNLPAAIYRSMTVRLYSKDYGWDQAARWHDRFPDLKLDSGCDDIKDILRKSRLFISTYNATTFLESFTMNVPTIIYWNPNHWELRGSAIPFFEDLKRVGIFHETPESAARHVTVIWDDVDAWWSSVAVREVLEVFKECYCRLPEDLLCQVEVVLRDAVENRVTNG